MAKIHDFESELAAASGEYTLEAPLHTLLGEAEDVAAFAAAYWAPILPDNDDGEVPRPGLSGAGPKLARKVIGEIRALVELSSEANTEALLAVNAKDEDPYERAETLYDELSLALAFAFDDGVDDEKDAQLAALRAEHKDAPASADALALRLEQTATLAQKHEADLAEIPAFDTTRIAAALAAAKALRATPGAAAGGNPERAAAYVRRNKLLNLLANRVRNVRAAARYIFRNQPEIVRLATSAHGRRVRAEARRAKKNKPAAPVDA